MRKRKKEAQLRADVARNLGSGFVPDEDDEEAVEQAAAFEAVGGGEAPPRTKGRRSRRKDVIPVEAEDARGTLAAVGPSTDPEDDWSTEGPPEIDPEDAWPVDTSQGAPEVGLRAGRLGFEDILKSTYEASGPAEDEPVVASTAPPPPALSVSTPRFDPEEIEAAGWVTFCEAFVCYGLGEGGPPSVESWAATTRGRVELEDPGTLGFCSDAVYLAPTAAREPLAELLAEYEAWLAAG